MKISLNPLLEVSNEIEQIFEESSSGNKNYYLSGIYSQCDIVNGNGRKYPLSLMEREINKLQTKINSKVAFGEFGHPNNVEDIPNINPERTSHRIIEIKKDGNNFVGKSVLIPAGLGEIAIKMIETGGVLSISSRGLGRVNKSTGIVEDNYRMFTYDLVFSPGMEGTNQNAILESKEFFVNEKEIFSEKEWKNIEKNNAKINEFILIQYDILDTLNKLKQI